MAYQKTIEELKKEQWTMPFGSMMNSFSQINQGKGITVDEFLNIADRFYNKSIKLSWTSLGVVSGADKLKKAEQSAKVAEEQERIEVDSKLDDIQREEVS